MLICNIDYMNVSIVDMWRKVRHTHVHDLDTKWIASNWAIDWVNIFIMWVQLARYIVEKTKKE